MNKDLQTIKAIEQAYGVELKRIDDMALMDVGYSLDADGQVTALSLSYCEITDVAPLAKLTQLKSLSLGSNQIIDVAPLANLTQLKSLYLSSNQIIDVAPLAKLTQLTSLNIDSNQIIDVAPLAKLTQLTILDLRSNQIIDVAPIANLVQLTELYLSYNQIIDVAPIANLTQLTELYLSYNQIIDVAPLAKLTQLTSLNIDSNQIIDVALLAKLTQLAELYLNGNQITDVAPLANLTQLTKLFLIDNQITDVAPLANLTQLTELYLSYNQIIDVAPIANFTQLIILDLARNQIIDVAPIDKLTQLEHLDLRNNCIQSLPGSLLQLSLDWHADGFHAKGLLLEGNSLQNPPLDVIKSGRQAIEAYYQSLEQGGERELREAKLILLGEPDAGKSSIVRRLLYNEFDPNSQTTLGTDIHRWKFQDADGEEYRVNIWDFGGQDIQQSIHHLFLTAGALYLVVLDARRDESPLQWLQTINAFAAGATVLIAVNQIDLNAYPKLNLQELRAAYPNIANVFYTSCERDQDQGLTQLITELKHHLAQLPSMGDVYPQQWYEIKERLEHEQSRGRHYMSMESYGELCAEHNMVADEGASSKLTENFLRVLDNIGTVRWFDKFEYFNYQVLDPSWLTIGLYHILINGEVKQRSGLVNRQQIKGILLYDIPEQYLKDGYKYRERDVDFFVEAIQHYKFAFKVEHNDGTPRYRIPKGFPQDPPARLNLQAYQGDNHRLYIIEFTSFAPAWLLHRLIVSLHHKIPEELYWYYGFVYRSAEGDTLVNLFEHERKLFIRVPKSAPNVYPWLRFCLFDIFADTMQLQMQEWVMFGEDNQARASLQQLRRYAAKGIQLYRDHDTLEEAPVAELLGLFPANIANADTTTALKELEILKTERQQDRELINQLIDLIKQLQTQPDERQQVDLVKKIKDKMDLFNSTVQAGTNSHPVIEALGEILKVFS